MRVGRREREERDHETEPVECEIDQTQRKYQEPRLASTLTTMIMKRQQLGYLDFEGVPIEHRRKGHKPMNRVQKQSENREELKKHNRVHKIDVC